MKKIALISALSVISIAQAYAANGTVIINGEVTSQSCKVVEPTGDTLTINLSKVGVNTLPTAGSTGSLRPFSIKLADCPVGKVTVYFEPHSASISDAATGRLKNQAVADTAAKNVDVQVLNKTQNPIDFSVLDQFGAQKGSEWVTTTAGSNVTLDYFAQYYATAPATPGFVTGKVQFTVIYQ